MQLDGLMRWVASLDYLRKSVDSMGEGGGKADKGKARDAAQANVT